MTCCPGTMWKCLVLTGYTGYCFYRDYFTLICVYMEFSKEKGRGKQNCRNCLPSWQTHVTVEKARQAWPLNSHSLFTLGEIIATEKLIRSPGLFIKRRDSFVKCVVFFKTDILHNCCGFQLMLWSVPQLIPPDLYFSSFPVYLAGFVTDILWCSTCHVRCVFCWETVEQE